MCAGEASKLVNSLVFLDLTLLICIFSCELVFRTLFLNIKNYIIIQISDYVKFFRNGLMFVFQIATGESI